MRTADHNGQGVAKDYREAVKYYCKAALQDYAEAQYSLGLSFSSGVGVPQNREAALMWLELAEAQGHKLAAAQRKEEYAAVQREQVAAAELAELAAEAARQARQTRYTCPKCRGELGYPPELAGQRAPCPLCGETIKLPHCSRGFIALLCAIIVVFLALTFLILSFT